MTDATNGRTNIPMPDAAAVERAIRITYLQVMLGSIFGASTGGMFLIGFAKELGADNILFGMLSTVPQFFVAFQFLGAWMVERGVSRRKQTIVFSLITPVCWFLVAAIPLMSGRMGGHGAIGILIGIMGLVTISNQFAGAARGSWIGELIPAERRSRFFGYAAMFGGIIGAGFAICEGMFLDYAKVHGLGAFTALFFFGSLFGVAAALLHFPQPDCPLPGSEAGVPYVGTMKKTLANKPFRTLAIVHAITALSGVAGPFWTVYLLRDVGVSFFGLSVLNCIGTVAAVVSAPLWGKVVAKFGCRPILILSLIILIPASLFWMPVGKGDVETAYRLVPWANLLGAVGGSALGVSISTFVYKASHAEGRSIQFAMYNTFVTFIGAPAALLGGALVSWLAAKGLNVDLRLTFVLWSLSLLAAAIVAKRLVEPDAESTKTVLFDRLPSYARARFAATVAVPLGLVTQAVDKIQKTAIESGKSIQEAFKFLGDDDDGEGKAA